MFGKTIVGHLMFNEEHVHSVHLLFRAEPEMSTLFCASQLGSAPSVAWHPPQLVLADVAGETLHDILQLD